VRFKYKLGDNYEILGIVKPNANTNRLTVSASLEVNKLTKKDILVYWGETNDIPKNNARNGLDQEETFIILTE
jgi:hypothetical protein